MQYILSQVFLKNKLYYKDSFSLMLKFISKVKHPDIIKGCATRLSKVITNLSEEDCTLFYLLIKEIYENGTDVLPIIKLLWRVIEVQFNEKMKEIYIKKLEILFYDPNLLNDIVNYIVTQDYLPHLFFEVLRSQFFESLTNFTKTSIFNTLFHIGDIDFILDYVEYCNITNMKEIIISHLEQNDNSSCCLLLFPYFYPEGIKKHSDLILSRVSDPKHLSILLESFNLKSVNFHFQQIFNKSIVLQVLDVVSSFNGNSLDSVVDFWEKFFEKEQFLKTQKEQVIQSILNNKKQTSKSIRFILKYSNDFSLDILSSIELNKQIIEIIILESKKSTTDIIDFFFKPKTYDIILLILRVFEEYDTTNKCYFIFPGNSQEITFECDLNLKKFFRKNCLEKDFELFVNNFLGYESKIELKYDKTYNVTKTDLVFERKENLISNFVSCNKYSNIFISYLSQNNELSKVSYKILTRLKLHSSQSYLILTCNEYNILFPEESKYLCKLRLHCIGIVTSNQSLAVKFVNIHNYDNLLRYSVKSKSSLGLYLCLKLFDILDGFNQQSISLIFYEKCISVLDIENKSEVNENTLKLIEKMTPEKYFVGHFNTFFVLCMQKSKYLEIFLKIMEKSKLEDYKEIVLENLKKFDFNFSLFSFLVSQNDIEINDIIIDIVLSSKHDGTENLKLIDKIQNCFISRKLFNNLLEFHIFSLTEYRQFDSLSKGVLLKIFQQFPEYVVEMKKYFDLIYKNHSNFCCFEETNEFYKNFLLFFNKMVDMIDFILCSDFNPSNEIQIQLSDSIFILKEIFCPFYTGNEDFQTLKSILSFITTISHRFSTLDFILLSSQDKNRSNNFLFDTIISLSEVNDNSLNSYFINHVNCKVLFNFPEFLLISIRKNEKIVDKVHLQGVEYEYVSSLSLNDCTLLLYESKIIRTNVFPVQISILYENYSKTKFLQKYYESFLMNDEFNDFIEQMLDINKTFLFDFFCFYLEQSDFRFYENMKSNFRFIDSKNILELDKINKFMLNDDYEIRKSYSEVVNLFLDNNEFDFEQLKNLFIENSFLFLEKGENWDFLCEILLRNIDKKSIDLSKKVLFQDLKEIDNEQIYENVDFETFVFILTNEENLEEFTTEENLKILFSLRNVKSLTKIITKFDIDKLKTFINNYYENTDYLGTLYLSIVDHFEFIFEVCKLENFVFSDNTKIVSFFNEIRVHPSISSSTNHFIESFPHFCLKFMFNSEKNIRESFRDLITTIVNFSSNFEAKTFLLNLMNMLPSLEQKLQIINKDDNCVSTEYFWLLTNICRKGDLYYFVDENSLSFLMSVQNISRMKLETERPLFDIIHFIAECNNGDFFKFIGFMSMTEHLQNIKSKFIILDLMRLCPKNEIDVFMNSSFSKDIFKICFLSEFDDFISHFFLMHIDNLDMIQVCQDMWSCSEECIKRESFSFCFISKKILETNIETSNFFKTMKLDFLLIDSLCVSENEEYINSVVDLLIVYFNTYHDKMNIDIITLLDKSTRYPNIINLLIIIICHIDISSVNNILSYLMTQFGRFISVDSNSTLSLMKKCIDLCDDCELLLNNAVLCVTFLINSGNVFEAVCIVELVCSKNVDTCAKDAKTVLASMINITLCCNTSPVGDSVLKKIPFLCRRMLEVHRWYDNIGYQISQTSGNAELDLYIIKQWLLFSDKIRSYTGIPFPKLNLDQEKFTYIRSLLQNDESTNNSNNSNNNNDHVDNQNYEQIAMIVLLNELFSRN
ncbi:hypothetical protein TVAG_168750 [Trichomonas vaginalis G3]|uniref:Uncharacterized protein n=1 Tax=Trichomonas vaginalis (strain ATCC PRA-98 / G3) TaxID=412133 RepID=A2FHE9_TRIV3|nr:hypothetical protein TVAGG3_0451220 [Trichomonas vaginalis G3]EAX95666.1 hypothetical protein TVAG_168750 [Trichomonas vaginalis G3]KAI5538168.1 hypothetical protein TVAGG3_0451220 [Trichomonas vaginalis G3]|eukprot:XP_001308596.1 hypothetical protein [Trichomonas vaginalis G3]